MARTRTLDPGHVAVWDISPDPSSVAPARAACARRLADWGLDQIAFTTELISELVTNAIRYGAEPIRLRLLLDRSTLICEVSDGSSTSPHLRRAKFTDEGGRELFLVAQFAQRWGTRYGARGKVIWTERNIRGGTAEPAVDLGEVLLDQWDEGRHLAARCGAPSCSRPPMAARAGISKAMLSEIENARISCSLTTLARLAAHPGTELLCMPEGEMIYGRVEAGLSDTARGGMACTGRNSW